MGKYPVWIWGICLSFLLCFSCTREWQAEGFHDLRVVSTATDDTVTVIFNRLRPIENNEHIVINVKKGDSKIGTRYVRLVPNITQDGYALNVVLKNKKLWSPKDPQLYTLTLKIINNEKKIRTRGTVRFGIRSLETHHGRFYLNGQPFYVRAYGGEGGCGCDGLSKEAIRKRLTRAKQYGFNAVRHHTHIPTDSYMAIADEVGVLVQMEIGGNQIGDNVKSERFSVWKERWIDMVKMGRTHPATFIYGCGNEMYGNSPGLITVLDSLYTLAKSLDPGTLVLNRSGSNPFNDDYGRFDLIERPIGEYEHRAEFAHEAFEAYLRGDRKGRTDEFPVIVHEYPLVASYPNPDLITKYDTLPFWIDTTITIAKKNGLEHLLPDYVKNSEAIQAIVRKEMLEEARKFPELDGYSMLRFTDCGAYVSGVVDDFADPKNVSAEEFLQTNGETVLLCSWNNRVLTNADTLRLTMHCSHHGGMPFQSKGGKWTLLKAGDTEAWENGKISGFEIPAVDVGDIAKIDLPLHDIKQAQKLTLKAWVHSGKKTIRNDWDFWVFPAIRDIETKKAVIWDPNKRLSKLEAFMPAAVSSTDLAELHHSTDDLILTDSWDESFYDHLDHGGNIWVLSGKTWPWPEEMGIFGLHITRIDPAFQAPPIFPQLDESLTNWLTICSNHPKRYGNSGTIVFDHPALNGFPHDGYCDMQFWPMIYRAKSLRLKDFPAGIKPMIQAIDNFYRGKYKGYLVEMQVGKGRLLISTLNLIQHLDYSASTRYMVQSLFEYMSSATFTAETKIGTNELKVLIDRYAEEIDANPPQVHSEMGARYTTLWERRLSPGKIMTLYPYEAEGVTADKLDIHYEYAQTQWYVNVAPGDELTWTFENDLEAEFKLHLNIASIFPGNRMILYIDGQLAAEFRPGCPISWQQFREIPMRMKKLTIGKHTIRLKFPEDLEDENGVAFLVRDLQVKEIIK